MIQTDIWKKYRKIEIIGSSAFCSVYRAKLNDEFFRIKAIGKLITDKNQLLREIEVMKKMECDNLMKIIEIIETKDSFYIVSELWHLSLAEYLNKIRVAL